MISLASSLLYFYKSEKVTLLRDLRGDLIFLSGSTFSSEPKLHLRPLLVILSELSNFEGIGLLS